MRLFGRYGASSTKTDYSSQPGVQTADQFQSFLDSYLYQLGDVTRQDVNEREVSLIARAPDSLVAQTLLAYAEPLFMAHVKLSVIFAHPAPAEQLAAWLDPEDNFHILSAAAHFRWIKHESLLDAHEQLVLGRTLCWSGGPMKDGHNPDYTLNLFEHDCPSTTRLGRMAFNALWEVSTQLPTNLVKRAIKSRRPHWVDRTANAPRRSEAEHGVEADHGGLRRTG